VAEPDVSWINSNWGSTSARFVRFVTADQPTIAIARTINEYPLGCVLVADQLLVCLSRSHSQARSHAADKNFLAGPFTSIKTAMSHSFQSRFFTPWRASWMRRASSRR
jgi:hypothetical protein